MMPGPLIYDVGMNVGDNIAYYLKKGFRVLGVDANPAVVEHVRRRFADEVRSGRVVVLNCGVGALTGTMPFYVSTESSTHSSFAAPAAGDSGWRPVTVPLRALSEIIAENGEPFFLKVDVEGLDAAVLHDLLVHGIRPPYISVEADRLETVCSLVSMGYTEFQLVNCWRIGANGRSQPIRKLDGSIGEHRFDNAAAGPFGDDLPDHWLAPLEMMLQWLGKRPLLGTGWYDLHARKPDIAAPLGAVNVGSGPHVLDAALRVTLHASRARLSRSFRRIRGVRHP